ncbi:MAG: DUF359 domain-containing protein [Candidatus Micrarchaeota archaeon]|nr:DUF359 domain-containing protein [Candidatus Micrarchaeota archaeon]
MLILPEEMREEIRKPFGKVLSGGDLKEAIEAAARPIIAVGDQCAYDLILAGTPPDMMIFDFKIRRVEVPLEIKKALAPHAKNAFVVLSGAGSITDELVLAVERLLAEGRGAVFVVGEDDLSALLVMAKAKEGTLIYGQPDQGAVVVPLGGQEIQRRALGFLERMEKKQ